MARLNNPWACARPELPWQPPDSGFGETRVISFKVWDLADVKEVARAFADSQDQNLVQYVTDDCRKNIAALGWEIQDVLDHLLLLTPDHYRGSEWCERTMQPGTRRNPDARWLPCDAYVLKIPYQHPATGWRGPVEYYIKFSFWTNRKLVCLVSCHTSN